MAAALRAAPKLASPVGPRVAQLCCESVGSVRRFCAPGDPDPMRLLKAMGAQAVARGAAWAGSMVLGQRQALQPVVSPTMKMRNYAVQLRDENRIDSLRDAQVLNQLQMTGMKHHKSVIDFKCKTSVVKSKMQKSLIADDWPELSVLSFIDGIEDTLEDKRMLKKFELRDAGGTFLQGGLWYRQEGELTHVTAMLWGSSFDMAKHVDHFEEHVEPIYDMQTTYEQMSETREVNETSEGVFFNSDVKRTRTFDVVKPIHKKVKVGEKITKTPIFKQKVCTQEEFEVAQRFLASQAAKEVLMLSRE